jgi:ATP-dependent RNA helicase DHX29
MYPGIAAVDGNRIRFAFQDWKSLIAVKVLRKRIGEVLRAAWKTPERELPPNQKRWVDIFWEVMEGVGKTNGKDKR